MISIKVTKLNSIFGQMRGLIGQEQLTPLLLVTRFGIHTFGLTKPIDILVLDSNGIVVKLKQNLMPNRIFLWNPRYNQIIELPKEYIKRKKIKKGSPIVVTL